MCVATEFASTPDWESAKTIFSVGISTVCLQLASDPTEPIHTACLFKSHNLEVDRPSQRMATSQGNDLPVEPTHRPAGPLEQT